MSGPKKTIVLIHGLWVTPRCWDKFRQHYEKLGHTVLAPSWPGVEGEVEDMQKDPSSFNGIGIAQVLERHVELIQSLPEPPILMGHSFGGLITQLLLDRGLGAAGVAIDSVPGKGIYILPFSTYEALTPALLNPLTAFGTYSFSFERWWRVFANSLNEEEARAAFRHYAIAAPGKAIFQAALSNVIPGSSATLHYANPKRAPLLVIGGEKDVIMPAALSRKIYAKHQASPSPTAYQEFSGRSHFIIGEAGWVEVADFAIGWALSQPSQTSATKKALVAAPEYSHRFASESRVEQKVS